MSDSHTRQRRDSTVSRRRWLSAAGTGLIGTALSGTAATRNTRRTEIDAQGRGNAAAPLALSEFEPKSMLHVTETHVARARFPVVDFHSHVSPRPTSKQPSIPPARMVPSMDAINVQTMVNLTGGSGENLAATIRAFDRAFPRRFVTMTEPTWTRAGEPGYAAWQETKSAGPKRRGRQG